MVHERWRKLELLVTNVIRNADTEALKDLQDNLDLLDETITLDCTTLTNHCICTVNFEYLHKPEHVIKCLRKRKCFHCQRYQCMRREYEKITASTQLILLAAAMGKFQVFKYLHQRGCSLESKTGVHELRPLHLAIIHGHFNVFCYLLAHQVDINAIMKSNGTSYSALMQAVLYNRKEMIRHLLMVKGLNLTFRNSLSQTPLLFAVQHNSLDLIDLLLGAEEAYLKQHHGQTARRLNKLQHPCAVLEAIKQDNSGILKTLLDNGCDPDYTFNGYHNYTTAAVLAAVKNSYRCLELLIYHGADIHTRIGAFSASEWATKLGWTKCVLVLNGSQYNSKSCAINNESFDADVKHKVLQTENETIEIECEVKEEFAVEDIEQREHSVVSDEVEEPSTSPLFAIWDLVQWVNVDEEINRLASLGHDVNIQDRYGRTSLHMAVEEQHLFGVRTLLQLGANTELKDMCGATPFWHAVFWNKESMIKELINANAKLECTASQNAYKLGLQLSDYVNDSNVQQKEVFKTPLRIAVEKKFHETLALLLESGYDSSNEDLDDLIESARDESKDILLQHLSMPKTLFATTRNFLRRQFGASIHSIANQYYLPTRIRDCLLLKDVLDCAYGNR